MVSGALVLAVLAQARFLFELDGVPVGTVELKVDGSRYTYRSTHAYRREKAERTATFTLGPDRPVPEGFWLWHRPKAQGCVDGVAELSNETGPLCADALGPLDVQGTTLGKAFSAQYDERGELTELQLGKSRFVRTAKALSAGQPYAKGFSISGKGVQLELEPRVEGTRWPPLTPRGTLSAPLPEADSCLEVARTFAAAKKGRRLALGLVVENGRGWPHAWVVSHSEGDIDPSQKAGGPPQLNRTYLELPAEQVGALYLELLEGKRKLVWR